MTTVRENGFEASVTSVLRGFIQEVNAIPEIDVTGVHAAPAVRSRGKLFAAAVSSALAGSLLTCALTYVIVLMQATPAIATPAFNDIKPARVVAPTNLAAPTEVPIALKPISATPKILTPATIAKPVTAPVSARRPALRAAPKKSHNTSAEAVGEWSNPF